MIDKDKEMNLNVGLHINCTEAYPESRYFDPEILSKEFGWLWGNQSVLIDKKKDLKSGKLFRRIDEMFDSVPYIDFLYVDTYQDRGWPLVKIRGKRRVKQVFSTAQSPDAWIGLEKKNDAPVIFVMDDLKILTR